MKYSLLLLAFCSHLFGDVSSSMEFEDVFSVNAHGDTALHRAIRAGSLEKVKSLVERGADLRSRSRYGETALELAIAEQQTQIVAFLIQQGEPVNGVLSSSPPSLSNLPSYFPESEQLKTPLFLAVRYAQLEMVKLLVERGADIGQVDVYGNTLLHQAVYRDALEIAAFLVEKGIALEAVNADGNTPLNLECSLEMMEFLIGKGADLTRVSSSGRTVLHNVAVAKNANADLVDLLLVRGVDVNARDDNQMTALHFAVQKGDVKLAETLLRAGASANVQNSQGSTLLHLAGENLEMLQLLVCNGADIHAVDIYGNTVLHDVRMDLETVRFLCERGAVPNQMNRRGQTSLDLAVRFGCHQKDLQVVKYLFEKGGDQTLASKEQRAARGAMPLLHIAAEFEDEAMAKLLLEHGSAIHDKDKKGQTALHVACWGGLLDAARWLIDLGADIHQSDCDGFTPLYSACCNRYPSLELIQLLLEKGARIDQATHSGNTPLHCAVERDYFLVAELLLKEGADVRRKNLCGIEPLCLAQDAHMVHLLLGAGAQVNATDENGYSALMYLVGKERGPDMTEMLLKRGADLNAKGKDGNTALHVALRCNPKMAEVLIEKGADVEGLTIEGNSLFYEAVCRARSGDCADAMCVVQALIDKGVDLEQEHPLLGGTALHMASDFGNAQLVRLLIDQGANIQRAHSLNGLTALHYACKERHFHVAQMLLERGAEVDAVDQEGKTPLFYAVGRDDIFLVELLLKKGACVHGNSPFQPLPMAGSFEMAAFLIANGAPVNSVDSNGTSLLHASACAGLVGERVAKLLIEKGANVNCVDAEGSTPLDIALRYNKTKFAQLLLDNGALKKEVL